MKKNWYWALLVGFLGGVFGTGGGLLAVWALRREKMDPKTAQATALGWVWPCAAVSATVYTFRGDVAWPVTLASSLGLTAGAAIGACWLAKWHPATLSYGLAALFLYSGIRLLFT